MKTKFVAVFFVTVFILFSCTKETKRPNILFIIADDISRTSMGAYGCNYIKTPNFDKIASEMAKQVEHMNALVEENAAARDLRSVSPLLRLAGALGFAVDTADPEHIAIAAAVHNLFCLHDPVMVAMIETNLEDEARIALFGSDNAFDVLQVSPWRLLAEDMLAGIEGRFDDLRYKPIRCAHEDGIDTRVYDRVIIRHHLEILKALIGWRGIEPGYEDSAIVHSYGFGPNAAHLAEADDSNS